MDPLAIIMSALSAGTVAAVQDTATQAVKDAYAGLRALIKRKFADTPNSEVILDEHAKDPETWEKPLEKALKDSKAENDDQIVQAAQKLVNLLQSQPAGSKFSVQISGSQGFVVGDNAQVEMNLANKSSDKKK